MRKLLDWTLFAAFVVGLWVLAAPATLGGATSFVIVDGRSMEPTYASGDLVVARRADVYEVGDVITYDAPVGATFRVVHRIAAVTDDGYITQGDNRDDPDRWTVPFAAVHGSSVLHLPHGGTVATALRQPPVLIGLAAGWATLVFLTRRDRRRERGAVTDPPPSVPLSRPARLGTAALFAGTAAFGLGAGVLVANAAALSVDAGTLQVFAFSDFPPPDDGGGTDPDTASVRVSWYLFNPGGRTRTDLATETLTPAVGATYDVASRAGIHDGKRYLEVDCVTSGLKDRPTADRFGSGTELVVDGDLTHAVCLEQQTGNVDAASTPAGSEATDEEPADDAAGGGDVAREDGS